MSHFHVPRDPFVTTWGSALRLPVAIRTRTKLSPLERRSHSIRVKLWLSREFPSSFQRRWIDCWNHVNGIECHHVGSTAASDSGGHGFRSRFVDCLHWHRILRFSSAHPNKYREYTISRHYQRIIPRHYLHIVTHYQRIISRHYQSYISCHYQPIISRHYQHYISRHYQRYISRHYQHTSRHYQRYISRHYQHIPRHYQRILTSLPEYHITSQSVLSTPILFTYHSINRRYVAGVASLTAFRRRTLQGKVAPCIKNNKIISSLCDGSLFLFTQLQ